MGLDLVGPKEIAEMLDVHPVTVGRWQRLKQLPEPDAVLSRGPIWLRQTIKSWAEQQKKTQ